MLTRLPFAAAFLVASLVVTLFPRSTRACCPAPPSGKPVVNADQTVIIIWDPVTKTEHFIRQASFKGEASDFGFLIPTPARPELDESGDGAFPVLKEMTQPLIRKVARPNNGMGCGCEKEGLTVKSTSGEVEILEEKRVAGFNAVVLRADTADVLVDWLKEKGYAFSPEVRAWVEPYISAGWAITALKVAKTLEDQEKTVVTASALRLSFKTDRPLFPYREPDPTKSAVALGASRRLLRIYFLSDARFSGALTRDQAWTGKTA